MKKLISLQNVSRAFALAFILIAAGCNMNNKGKVAEIPATTKSDDAKTSFQQGLAAFDQNDFQKARMLFTKATTADPKLGVAYAYSAFVANSPKEFADNITNAKANTEGASDYEKWFCEEVGTFPTNDVQKRMEIAQKISTTYPDVARAQTDLAAAHSAMNDEGKARECIQKAITMNPNWVGGYTAGVNSYVFIAPKDFKKAEEMATKAAELAPQSAGVQIALGDCYRAQNQLEKARDAYGKAIQNDPASSEAYYKKGNANSFLGNLDEARKNFTEGTQHDDNKFGAQMAMGNTYLYGGDAKAAISYFNEQAAKADASGESEGRITAAKLNCLTNSANIAMHNGDVETLKGLVTQIEPLAMKVGNDVGTEESKMQQKASVSYWQSILAALEGNFDVAKSKAEEVKTAMQGIKDPNNMDSYEFAMGFMSMKQKSYADAVSHFEKTQQNSTYNKYWLATANLAAGNKDKAAAIYKDIENYNFNEVGYAMIRNEVKKTLASL